ncbi:MAG: hypothetical protein PHV28_16045 [Kiritimatiellae bacterium]|nr:hypothetical protein [Kiritimatiellia bacterium]
MKKTVWAFFMAVFAASAADVNLLNNPEFKLDADRFPADWCFNREGLLPLLDFSRPGEVAFRPSGTAVSFRQSDIHLVPGRRYRLGAWVRTEGLAPKQACVLVYNYAWTKAEGVLSLPEDTHNEWKRVECVFTAPESRDELYTFTVYMKGSSRGSCAVRAPWLFTETGAPGGEEPAPRFSGSAWTPPHAALTPTSQPEFPARRLNALVTRLLSADTRARKFVFRSPREGWVWIALDGGGTDTRVFLDGAPESVVSYREGERFETMRRLTAGEHRLNIEGEASGRITVNAIPCIFAYSYPAPHPKDYRFYAGAFLHRHLHPAINTFSYGYSVDRIPKADLADLKSRGKELFSQMCRWNAGVAGYRNRLEPPEHLAARFRAHPGATRPELDGFAYDEISAAALLEKLNYTRALRLSKNLAKPLYTWSSGVKFELNELNAAYLSACAAVSGGKGRLLFECYAVTQPDEGAAEKYLDDFLDGSLRRAEKLAPGFAGSALIVNGLYTRLGGYCTDCRPEADVKRFYDLYFHRLATRSVFEDLAGVGVYAINNADEENLRWFLRLIRHYALEGRTTRLSDEYGFTYTPVHAENGDFARGLTGWESIPAEPGSLRAGMFPGYSALQKRKVPDAPGDTACVFRRSVARPNILRRKLTGLTPGKLYSLWFATADAKEIKEKKGTSRRFVLKAEVRGAEDVTASSPAVRWGEALRVTALLNERIIVFRAISSEAELIFSDWETPDDPGATAGEEILLNAVRVKPYYTDDN